MDPQRAGAGLGQHPEPGERLKGSAARVTLRQRSFTTSTVPPWEEVSSSSEKVQSPGPGQPPARLAYGQDSEMKSGESS